MVLSSDWLDIILLYKDLDFPPDEGGPTTVPPSCKAGHREEGAKHLLPYEVPPSCPPSERLPAKQGRHLRALHI